ncbi:kinase-like protein [Exidia glandulosa HHB12029]|uniref:Kinase-like protein n=1 Tax=Exidia glandulosa HHB12029 TaxID=1314781 RepID=A0A166NM58_EXIGL|nr:kinase-like protein [Exidia glandulosa HHB12029]
MVPVLDDDGSQSECLRMQDLLSQRLSSVAHAVSRQQDMRSLVAPTSESTFDFRETAEERLLQELQTVASELDDALADWMIPRRLELKAAMGGSMLRTKSFDFLRSPPALSTDSLVSVNSLSSLQETPPLTPPSQDTPIPPKAAVLLGLNDHDRERSHSASSWLTSLLRAVSPHAEDVDGQRLRSRRRRPHRSTGIGATSTVQGRDGSEAERTSPGRPGPVTVTGTQHRGLRRLFRSLPALRTVAEAPASKPDERDSSLVPSSDAAESTSRLSVRNSVRSQRSHSCSTVAQSSNAHSEDHTGLSEVYAHYFSSSPHSASVLAAARSSLSLRLTSHEYSSLDSLPSIIECVEPVLDGGVIMAVDMAPSANSSSPDSAVRQRSEVASIWKPYRDLTSEVFDVTPRPCGIGGVSDVYSATWIANEAVDSTGNMFMKVAVKVVRVRKQSHEKTLKRLRREIHVWEQLNHNNVLPLCGVYFGLGDLPALISPWCENGDICDYLAKRQAEFVCDMHDLKLRLLLEVAEGLQYLHSHTPEIIHGDLKGLCDFGFASVLAQELGSFVLRSSSAKGTWRWMAPELFTQDDAQHTKATDIWAYGCVIAEVWSGRPPYHERLTEPAAVLAIARGEQPSRPQDVPEGLWSLATGCYASDPDQRPGLLAAVLAIRELRSMSA